MTLEAILITKKGIIGRKKIHFSMKNSIPRPKLVNAWRVGAVQRSFIPPFPTQIHTHRFNNINLKRERRKESEMSGKQILL